jgi:hypothetical protein
MRLPQALKRSGAAILLVVGTGVAVTRCGQVILTAPAGSRLVLEANPPFIEAHGGVSVITAVVIEPAGTPVPDGTVVQFFTTLGRIDEQGRTNDGVARVNLLATSLSGVASVTAVSGGEAPEPTTTSTSTATTSTTRPGATTTTTMGPGVTTSTTRPPSGLPTGPRSSLGFAEGEGQATMTVAIGSARPVQSFVTADPPRVTAQRPSRITVIVIDASGNPVANVPVFFSIRAPTGTETLDSGGDPVFTDNNGMAFDTLRTTASAGAARSVIVDARAANGVTNSVTVGVS